MLAMPFALAGGSFVFLAFLVVFFLAIAYAYYSRSGTEITPRGAGEDAMGDPESFRDTSQVVTNWSRGTGSKHQRNKPKPRTPEELAEALDPETLARLQAWREHLKTNAAPGLVAPPDPARDHVRGSAEGEVTIVAYGDFQCPACQTADWEIRTLQKELGEDRLLYVFRHFPLADVHLGALDAAQAVEHAATRGRFWDLHDAIYRSSRPPTRESLMVAAQKVGIGADELVRVLDERPYTERIAEDFDTGMRSGVDGTPTLFVNGVRHDGDMDRETIRSVIEAAPS
jgi:protein-disulfide isomerase